MLCESLLKLPDCTAIWSCSWERQCADIVCACVVAYQQSLHIEWLCRALGGLLSAYSALLQNPALAPPQPLQHVSGDADFELTHGSPVDAEHHPRHAGSSDRNASADTLSAVRFDMPSTIVSNGLQYSRKLLTLARDLADRLLPAFDTRTGIPLSWVNLRKGIVQKEVQSTCLACTGTLTLEFHLLSHFTGDVQYAQAVDRAMVAMYARRDSTTQLLGNTIDTRNGQWTRHDAGIGAGADSFVEYLLKMWLAFGNEEYMHMFVEQYVTAERDMLLQVCLFSGLTCHGCTCRSGQSVPRCNSCLLCSHSFWYCTCLLLLL